MVTNNTASTFLQTLATFYCLCMISGFRHKVTENGALLGYYAARKGDFLPMFWNNISVPSTGFKNPKESL
jgi:hypothetical protein